MKATLKFILSIGVALLMVYASNQTGASALESPLPTPISPLPTPTLAATATPLASAPPTLSVTPTLGIPTGIKTVHVSATRSSSTSPIALIAALLVPLASLAVMRVNKK
jgi:hypothetical protein